MSAALQAAASVPRYAGDKEPAAIIDGGELV
jgi:hypothetical protein